MAAETKKNNDAETETPQDIPVSTIKSDPITGSYKKSNADVISAKVKLEKLLEKLSIEPATAEAPAVGPTPAVVAKDSDSTKEDNSLSNPWTEFVSRKTNGPTTATQPKSSRHLEAYVLRPHIETSKDNVTWSSKVEPLGLDEAAIASADMVTTMGAFKVKSVIFIIAIQSRDGSVLTETKRMVEVPEVRTFACPFNSSQTFQPRPNTNNDPLPGASSEKNEKPSSSGCRLGFAQNSEGLASLFQSNRPISASPFSSPENPRTNDPVELCNSSGTIGHNEENQGDRGYRDIGSGEGEVLHYMTITAQELYGLNPPSLEELRVRDYAVGLTVALTIKPKVKHSPKSDTSLPFGGQYVNPKAPAGAPTVPQPPSMAWMGIFKNSPPTQSNLSKLSKEPASGKPACKPTSTTLLSRCGVVSNPTPGPGGNIGQQTSSGKSDLWERHCKRRSTYIILGYFEEPGSQFPIDKEGWMWRQLGPKPPICTVYYRISFRVRPAKAFHFQSAKAFRIGAAEAFHIRRAEARRYEEGR
ncbi:uncharacterized protein ALTATR162_LOCUS3733 [Alternaria atra]|uniref:Uncharacterized protein n=1 Tax=Alternaria atra TaxID=119953 RepID=A0A8J2MYF7_9PLEO|nr:uncharacterized protein ALTATR162_LOCUS3733 [Alternaria atra]CAG5155584.1 unnamed protein product [Alternaria atra]